MTESTEVFRFCLLKNLRQHLVVQILYALCAAVNLLCQIAAVVYIHRLFQRNAVLIGDVGDQSFFEVFLIDLLQNTIIHASHLQIAFEAQQPVNGPLGDEGKLVVVRIGPDFHSGNCTQIQSIP